MKETTRTSRSGEISVRDINLPDLWHVADVHMAAFPKGALTQLGAGVVRRYYNWQLADTHQCVAIGAWQGSELCGFIFAGSYDEALGGFLEKDKLYLLGRVISKPWLAMQPWFRERIRIAFKSLLRGFSKRRARKADVLRTNHTPDVNPFGILVIAVAPTAKRKGAGSLLMQSCEEIARERGAERVNLTVSADNMEAIRFYEKLGWQRDGQPGSWKGGMFKLLA